MPTASPIAMTTACRRTLEAAIFQPRWGNLIDAEVEE
jgi:hypothetical protein